MGSGLDFAVRYPFTAEARKAIEGVELNERIVDLATGRIRKALDGDSRERVVLHDSDKKEDIASFAAARMILGHLRNPFLTNRFAVNESKMARGRIDKADAAELDAVARSFGINTTEQGGEMVLDLPTYLRFSPRSVEYRIINRRIADGMVWIRGAEKKRLMEEAVKKHIEKMPFVRDPPDSIVAAGEKLIAALPKAGGFAAPLKVTDHPPCIERLLESARKHENLPHQARYYLATYFLAIKAPEDDIVQVFSNFPDYSEKITRYQVRQIGKKAYSVPSCATVMGYGLCCAVCRIGTPLRWHSLDAGRKDGIRKEKAETEG